MASNGDNGSPCCTPLSHWNSHVGDPFINTEARANTGISLIHILRLTIKFMAPRTESMKDQLIESSALFKSIFKKNAERFDFLSQEWISFRINGPSSILLPETYAICDSETKDPITTFNLLARTLEIDLLIHPRRLIGR